MAPLTPELVNLYIKSAQPFANSKAELRAIRLAQRLNSPSGDKVKIRYKKNGKFIRRLYAYAEEPPPDKLLVDSWKTLILKEMHAAFCLRIARYRKAVNVLTENANTLIALIAGYVAAKLGIAIAVIAALVASLLRIVATMGVSVFCKRFAQGQQIA
jgi:hypothetical protein